MSKPMSYEGVEIEKRTLKTRILFSVPGAGVEPARIAPSVFETDASTDSAIRALRLQSYMFFLNHTNKHPFLLDYAILSLF